MRNFDVFAASPENLGTFLGSLTVVNSPWEKEFNKVPGLLSVPGVDAGDSLWIPDAGMPARLPGMYRGR